MIVVLVVVWLAALWLLLVDPRTLLENLADVLNMDPQIRRWLIALVIAIVLFAIGMAMSISHLI